MSRSKKDGRRRGGHRNTQNKEVWSRRCRKVSMWDTDSTDYKRITHRFERRRARVEVRAELESVAPLAATEEGDTNG